MFCIVKSLAHEQTHSLMSTAAIHHHPLRVPLEITPSEAGWFPLHVFICPLPQFTNMEEVFFFLLFLFYTIKNDDDDNNQ